MSECPLCEHGAREYARADERGDRMAVLRWSNWLNRHRKECDAMRWATRQENTRQTAGLPLFERGAR